MNFSNIEKEEVDTKLSAIIVLLSVFISIWNFLSFEIFFFPFLKVGIQEIHHKVRPYEVELIRRDYWASDGWETFLSYEDPDQDILVGLLRLRKPSADVFRPELKNGVSIVRELHVYGSVVPVAARDPSKFQHQGLYSRHTIFT